MGSHLDSVPEGPGINDNGSGSASVYLSSLSLFFYKFLIFFVLKFTFL